MTNPNFSVSPELNARLAQARPGQIVEMGDLPMVDLPRLNYDKQASGPQYLFSDDPEYFRVGEGAAMREEVRPGVFRLYVYHVNGVQDTEKKITAVIENLGDKPLSMRFLRYAFAGPSNAYYEVGKSGLVQYLSAKPQDKVTTVPVGGAAPIDPAMEASRVKYDELVHGFYDIEIDQPARVTTLQTDVEVPGPEACRRIGKVLDSSSYAGAGRGLYQVSTYDVKLAEKETLDTARGALQLVVADGKQDPWIEGTDSSSTTPSLLKGNYGVIYNIELEYKSSDGRALALLTWNRQAGAQWCDALAAAMQVSEGAFDGGLVKVPGDCVAVGGKTSAVLLQLFAPVAKGESRKLKVTYSPPGASCLPTPFLLIPVETNNQ